MSFKKPKKLFSQKHRQPDPVPDHENHHGYVKLEDYQAHESHTDGGLHLELPFSSDDNMSDFFEDTSSTYYPTYPNPFPHVTGSQQNLANSQMSLPLSGNEMYSRLYPPSTRQPRPRSISQSSDHSDHSQHSYHSQQSHRSCNKTHSHHSNLSNVAEPQIPPFPMNPYGQPPFPSHPPLEQQNPIPDEILLTVVSCLMHRRNCQIPNCLCKSVQARYRELYPKNPSYRPHQHTAESGRSEGDSRERKHQLHLTLSSENLNSDTHPHYHLTTRSHIRHVRSKPSLVRQHSRSIDHTPIQEFQHELPAKSSSGDADDEDGFTSNKPPYSRVISLSADNIPALCINDCPLTPPPLSSSQVPVVKLPDIEQLFQEAMKRGHVMCRTLNYAVTGAAGTGKSHTVSLILNEDPPEERHSTGLLNSPIRAISSSLAVGSNLDSEAPTLRRAKEGDILDILAICAKQGISTQDSAVPDEQLVTSAIQDSAIQDSALPDEQQVNTSAVQDSAALDEQQVSTSGTDGEDYRNLQAVQELFARLAGGMMEAEVSDKHLGAFDFVHLLDSGGQPQFHQLLPTFVPHLDANIFVLKLCEMLDQHPTVEFYHKGKLVTSYPSFHTNQQILKHCIRAIQSQSSPDGDSTTRIAVVGTHKDQQDKCSEKLKEKNKELIALLKSKFSSDNLIYYQPLQEMIFPVNAKTPDEEDREVAQQLVKSITENGSSKAKPIPLPWFLLEQMLRKVAEDKGTGVLHISECQEIANKLGIRREALGAALGYLVGLNLFLYYPSVLPKVFFSEPQVFLDKINELVHCSHLLRGDSNLLPDELKVKLRGLCGKQWERFGYYGILTEELLKHKVFSSYYVYDDELFTPANLLELLQALLIISPINRMEFIMPCLLPDLDAEELDKHRSEVASSIAPLLIHFPNEWPQSGVFCSLMASLLSYSEWEVLQGGNSEPMCLYQNCIDFQLPGPGIPGMVTLIDSFDSGYFEVHVDDNCKPLCPQIRQTIFTTLERIPNAPKPVIAFFCPQEGKRCKAFCHRACFICSCRYWKCSENPRVNGKLTECQLAWLESGNSTTAETQGNRPTLMELLKFRCKNRTFNIAEEIATKYVELSVFLLNDSNGSRAEIMACKHQRDAQRINTEILHEWLTGRGRQPVTWETLVEVLQDIELCTLASDIVATKCLSRCKETETLC